jgi:hypothetical protein
MLDLPYIDVVILIVWPDPFYPHNRLLEVVSNNQAIVIALIILKTIRSALTMLAVA